jgi:hypothetical protein
VKQEEHARIVKKNMMVLMLPEDFARLLAQEVSHQRLSVKKSMLKYQQLQNQNYVMCSVRMEVITKMFL